MTDSMEVIFMKRIISKLLLAALLTALTCGSAFAASAKVTYVKGKVEVNRGDSWVALIYYRRCYDWSF